MDGDDAGSRGLSVHHRRQQGCRFISAPFGSEGDAGQRRIGAPANLFIVIYAEDGHVIRYTDPLHAADLGQHPGAVVVAGHKARGLGQG